MKFKLRCLLVLSAWLAIHTQTARATVALVITPSAVSNTYSGILTLQITGLTNAGQTVVVQKFLDANTNGVVDAGDLLVQQFNLTDGNGGMVIGGVTNNNVPGDTDTTATQITAKLNFQSDWLQTFAGSYLVKLSSPSNAFTALTNSFTVTNFNYAQKFTGTVLSNGAPIPNALVFLFPTGKQNNPTAGAVANNSGVYSLPAPAGSYTMSGAKSNYVAPFSGGPTLTLTNGTTFNTNFSLTPATQTISGKISDTNNGALGLPGISVAAQTQNRSLLGICFADTNGNYTIGVTSNQWGLSPISAGMALHGYVAYQNKPVASVSNANVTGLNIAYPKATAFFYGTVKDGLGNPLPGEVAVYAQDNNNGIYESDGYADTSGNYVTGIVGGLGAGDPWNVDIDNSSSFPTYIFSQPAFDQNGGTNVTTGQAVLANFTALQATNVITGNVKFKGTNLVGVGVSAVTTNNGTIYNLDTATTDANGNYSLTVGNGTWAVFVSDCQCSDANSLNNVLAGAGYQDPNNDYVTIANNNGTANFVVPYCGGVQINTSSPLPGGTVGNYYSQQFNASSCYGNFNWSIVDPQDAPPGLTLYSGGSFNGTPTQAGTYNFTVQAMDGGNYTGTSNMSLTIAPAVVPLQITNIFLTNAIQNASYHFTLGAIGGTPPYAWALATGSASLPAGLTLRTNGVISGTPIGSGTANFLVQVTDAALSTVYQGLSLNVNSSSLPQAITLGLVPSSTGALEFSFQVASGVTYTVQSSTNLKTWNKYETFSFSNSAPTSGSTWTVTIPNSLSAARTFYRVKVGP